MESLQQPQGSGCAFAGLFRSRCQHLGEDRREGSLLPPQPQLLPPRREGGREGGRELCGRPAASPGCCQPRGRRGIPGGLRRAASSSGVPALASTASLPWALPSPPARKVLSSGPRYSPAVEPAGLGESAAGLRGGTKAG